VPLRLRPLYAKLGENDQGPIIHEILTRKETSARTLLLDILESLDVDAYMRAGGLGSDDLAAIRARLLGPETGRTADDAPAGT